jgi:hypothetical protein
MGENPRQGVMLRVLFKDPGEAVSLARVFAQLATNKDLKRGDGSPCAASILVTVDGDVQTHIAKQLGLF